VRLVGDIELTSKNGIRQPRDDAAGSKGTEMPDFDATSAAFTAIYANKVWGEGSGASGPDLTQPLRMLANFMHNNAVTSVVDVGCGDWQFSRVMDWSGIRYHGFDVVDTVIHVNKERFASENITFATMHNISDLPKADLVVCKDVLEHLPNRDVNEYLDYFSKHYKYAIVTNDIFPDAHTNLDIPYGAGRALRLDQEPFDRRIAVLVRWTTAWQEHIWIKDACLLLGVRGSPTTNAVRWRHRLRGSLQLCLPELAYRRSERPQARSTVTPC